MKGLICDSSERLGAIGGIEDFKRHAFFKDIEWEELQQTTAPFVPELSGPTDVRYFEEYRPVDPSTVSKSSQGPRSVLKKPTEHEFVGFTYRRYKDATKRKVVDKSMFEKPSTGAGSSSTITTSNSTTNSATTTTNNNGNQ